jgi:hypothetical protein
MRFSRKILLIGEKMKKLMKIIITIILGFYLVIFSLSATYYNWQYAKDYGFVMLYPTYKTTPRK